MDLKEYYSFIKNTPFPTEEQFDNFVVHVGNAHSWYKHLDLFAGAEFVVFLDPRAGGGFTDDQPRIHHTWKTRQEYVQKFGHLAYMYRYPGDSNTRFTTDYAFCATVEAVDAKTARFANVRETPDLILPTEIMTECGFRLYPFVIGHHMILSRFEHEICDMERGVLDHPCRSLLLAVRDARNARDDASNALSAALGDPDDFYDLTRELRQLTDGDEDVDAMSGLDALQRRYVQTHREIGYAWGALCGPEWDKIQDALDSLRKHLGIAGLVPAPDAGN